MYDIFEKILKLKGITAYRVSKETGITTVTFTNWKKGLYTPKIDKMEKIADYLGVTVDYLYGYEEKETPPKRKGVKIPVLGMVPCGMPIEAIEEVLDYEEITPELARTGTFYGLVAQGDSMTPYILDGDVLIVKQTSAIDSGKIGIVKVNGDDATCKKIMIGEQGITLVSQNPMYEPMFYTSEKVEELPVCICGQVVEFRRKLI